RTRAALPGPGGSRLAKSVGRGFTADPWGTRAARRGPRNRAPSPARLRPPRRPRTALHPLPGRRGELRPHPRPFRRPRRPRRRPHDARRGPVHTFSLHEPLAHFIDEPLAVHYSLTVDEPRPQAASRPPQREVERIRDGAVQRGGVPRARGEDPARAREGAPA